MESTNYLVIPFMTAAALTCAAAAALAYTRRRAIAGIREPILWSALALTFTAFILMKLDGISELIESAGRDQAKAGGLYAQRHLFQVMVIAGVALLATLLAMSLRKHLAKRWQRYQWSILGTAAIAAFGLIRMVSIHELDALGGILMLAKAIIEIIASAAAAYAPARRIAALRSPAPASDSPALARPRKSASAPVPHA